MQTVVPPRLATDSAAASMYGAVKGRRPNHNASPAAVVELVKAGNDRRFSGRAPYLWRCLPSRRSLSPLTLVVVFCASA